MAGTIHQLVSVKSSEHKECRLLWKEYVEGPLQYPEFKTEVLKESLWINPSWVCEELKSRGLAQPSQAEDGKFCNSGSVIHDEGTAFVALLRTCSKNKDLHKGTRIHDDILKRGLLEKCSDALVTMYAKCGVLVKAKELLDTHKSRDVFSWTALIAGYIRQRRGQDALNCFEQMQNEGLSPDAVTFACILKACGILGVADKGKQIHNEIASRGLLENNVMLGNALVDMYAKCGALAKAQQVLEELPSRDVVSWNAMIAGYAQEGQGKQALNCFACMKREGIPPDAMTFVCILKACGTLGAVERGGEVHDEIARQGLLENNVVLGNALVDMYAKCGALAMAQQVLVELPYRNVVSWTALIAGYAQQGQGEQALHCFQRMQCEGLSPNIVTFACILKACGTIGALDKGKQIHDNIARQGLLGNNVVLGTALVDMYAKCGALANAQQVFEQLPFRDVVSWTALIAGYAEQGQGEEALNYFECMHREGIPPNVVTFACILKACGAIGAIDKGKQIHDQIVRRGLLGNNVSLGNALVDMYAKCGALAEAQIVFEELPSRDVISWNSLIAGYTQKGQGDQALSCFEQMQHEGLSANTVTYASTLKACGTIGAVDKGKQIHDEIAKQGLLGNNVVLGTALVDMYIKCCTLAQAQQVLEELLSRDVVSWTALIAGYAEQGQAEEALSSFNRMQREGITPNAATFSCVLNVCSHLGLIEDGHMHFVDMITKYGIKPDLELYTCMIDLFGRAGHLEKAVRVIQEMPSSAYTTVWHTLLGACCKWRDVNVGRWAFEQAIHVDKSDGASYVLMANIYAVAGMQENAKNIEIMRIMSEAWKKPSSWIDMSGNVHAFFIRDTKHTYNNIFLRVV